MVEQVSHDLVPIWWSNITVKLVMDGKSSRKNTIYVGK